MQYIVCVCVYVWNVLRLIMCVRDYLIGIFVFGLSECCKLISAVDRLPFCVFPETEVETWPVRCRNVWNVI